VRETTFHFSFLILQTVGRTPWTGIQPVASLHTGQHKQKKRTQLSMSRVGVFEQAKSFHALDRAVTVIGHSLPINVMKIGLHYTYCH
jgi:hypothetical protein